MIRDAVLHLNNEQPMLADLFELPEGHDVGLRCTNLRTMNGKRPIFVDHIASVFFFPYLHIRFVEIPPGAAAEAGIDTQAPGAAEEQASRDAVAVGAVTDIDQDADLEIDEDFLRRVREA
jgi:hypothetical protein